MTFVQELTRCNWKEKTTHKKLKDAKKTNSF